MCPHSVEDSKKLAGVPYPTWNSPALLPMLHSRQLFSLPNYLMLSKGLLSVLLSGWVASGFQLVATPGNLSTTIPAACRVAMTANVTCDPLLLFAINQTNSFDKQELDVLCTSSCKNSLETFLATIHRK